MKTGQVERTVDSEFSDEESKYRALEKECGVLQKEAKAYLDAMRSEYGSGVRVTINRMLQEALSSDQRPDASVPVLLLTPTPSFSSLSPPLLRSGIITSSHGRSHRRHVWQ